MRSRSAITAAILTVCVASSAPAQPVPSEVLPSRSLSFVDFGVRGTSLSGDAARFQRYRDLGDGAFLDGIGFIREGPDWLVRLSARHAGRTDQRYTGELQHAGRLTLTAEWDQIPTFISGTTRTLYARQAPGVLRLDDAIQQGVQAGTLTLAQVAGGASPFDTRNRRDTARARLVYSPTEELDLTFRTSTVRREGTMPWGATFGLNNAVEVPAPLDSRTTDIGLGLEWGNRRGMVRFGYDGSWFDNRIPTLVWDNPRKLTDSVASHATGLGGAQGRMALSPGSTRHGVSSAASIGLPRRSRLTGTIAVGALSQNEPLLPFTINTAIAPIPLPRATAEAQARTVSSTLSFTSRPVRRLWLNARYRYYDFDTRTPHFPVPQYVRADQIVGALPAGGPEPYDLTRQQVDADASVAVAPFTSLKVGYGREHADRTNRVYGTTVQDTVRASIDTVGPRVVSVRLQAEYATREGRGLDLHVLELVGEQPGMRHFDVAARDRSRVTALLSLTPAGMVGISASAGAGKDDYKESEFGLRDNTHRVYGLDFDFIPRDAVAFNVAYAFERYDALHLSRSAAPGPEFVDPRRNWSTDSADRVHTVTGSLDLLRLWPRTEIRLAYDLSSSRATYVYQVGPALPVPSQLPPVTSELRTGTLDGRYFLTDRLAVGLVYWYERFGVEDFALGNARLLGLDMPGGLMLGQLYEPYRAHSVWARLIYTW